MFYIGIDDSGRGPIIGPMVLAGVLVDEKQIQLLKRLNVKDSKLLTPTRREFLSKEIKAGVSGFHIVKAFPIEIDDSILKKVNLNKLEAIKSAEIINNLSKDIDSVEVIIDCPSTNILSWKDYVFGRVKEKDKIKLRCEHKADINHSIVSAASILAKVARDAEIEKIKKKIGNNFGSGYPSDPFTVQFLKKYSQKYKNAGIFRKSWATWKNNEKARKQKKLGEY